MVWGAIGIGWLQVEVAVKKIINNITFQRQDGALRNPESLDLYYDIPELELDMLAPKVKRACL